MNLMAGRFRWVACQLEELQKCSKSIRTLQDTLERIPETLEKTYDQILMRVPEVDAVNAMKLLVWLTFGEESFMLEDIARVVEINVNGNCLDTDGKLLYPHDVLRICSSLVTLMDDETVQLAHASVKEYMLAKPRRIGSNAVVDPSKGHLLMSQFSLVYILQVDALPSEDLIDYCANYWPKHVLASKEESAEIGRASCRERVSSPV